MKILIYTHEFPPFLGGLSKTSFNLAQGLSSRGFELAVLAPSYPDLDYNSDQKFNFNINRMSRLTMNHGIPSPVKEFTGTYYIKNKISGFKPDVLIAITREAHFACGLLKQLPEVSIARVAGYEAYRYLSGSKFINRLISIPMRNFYNRSKYVVTPSKATRELYVNANIPDTKIRVVYNGIDSEFMSNRRNEDKIEKIRRNFGITNEDKVILTVSRIVRGKGQDNVIKALPEVIKKISNVKYLIVGDGKDKGYLKNIIDKLSLESNVIFAGSVTGEETINYYDLCDLFIIANRTSSDMEHIEGLPNVIYEASSRGKPIITGNPGGAKEVVKDNQSGYVIDSSDVDHLAERIVDLLTDVSKSEQFGKRVRKSIENNFTLDHMIDGYVEMINN